MHSVRENEFRVQNNQKMCVAFFKSAYTALLTLMLRDSSKIFSRNEHLILKQEFSSNARHRGN